MEIPPTIVTKIPIDEHIRWQELCPAFTISVVLHLKLVTPAEFLKPAYFATSEEQHTGMMSTLKVTVATSRMAIIQKWAKRVRVTIIGSGLQPVRAVGFASNILRLLECDEIASVHFSE